MRKTFRTASQGTDTVGQQRVGDENVRDTCIGQQFSTEINHVESVMEGMRKIGISGVNGESRGRKTPSQFIQAIALRSTLLVVRACPVRSSDRESV